MIPATRNQGLRDLMGLVFGICVELVYAAMAFFP